VPKLYLRLLAEAELRHAARAAPVSAGRWSADSTDSTLDKMRWAALALASVHAVEIETAETVLADYAAALGVRPRSGQGRPMLGHPPSLPHGPWRAPWFTWPTRDSQVGAGSPRPAGSQSPGQPRPTRLVPTGLTGRYCHDVMDGELHLLSYSRTASGVRLAIA
jgi:hypothetical protein